MNNKAPKNNDVRTIFQLVMSFVFPPLAVLERGCGVVLLVFILTVMGWFPGVLAALYMTLADRPGRNPGKRKPFIQIPVYDDADEYEIEVDAAKRKGAYIRLADGEIAEVVEDEGAKSVKRKRGR